MTKSFVLAFTLGAISSLVGYSIAVVTGGLF